MEKNGGVERPLFIRCETRGMPKAVQTSLEVVATGASTESKFDVQGRPMPKINECARLVCTIVVLNLARAEFVFFRWGEFLFRGKLHSCTSLYTIIGQCIHAGASEIPCQLFIEEGWRSDSPAALCI